jgi:hypothetical protein
MMTILSSTKRLLPQTFQDCYRPTTRTNRRCYSRCCPRVDSRSGRFPGRLDSVEFGGTASRSSRLRMRHSRPMVTCCHVILVSVDLPLGSPNLKFVRVAFRIHPSTDHFRGWSYRDIQSTHQHFWSSDVARFGQPCWLCCCCYCCCSQHLER